MSQVIAMDMKGNKNFVTKSKIEVESNCFVGDYFVKQAFFKKIKSELLVLVEKDNSFFWWVLKVKEYRPNIEEYKYDKNETEFRQAFKI